LKQWPWFGEWYEKFLPFGSCPMCVFWNNGLLNGGRCKSSLATMEMVMVGFNNDGSNDYYKNMFFY
jgi:hypothetical protein